MAPYVQYLARGHILLDGSISNFIVRFGGAPFVFVNVTWTQKNEEHTKQLRYE